MTQLRRVRVIPTLLLRGEGLYKTLRFKDPVYVGDPINAVKLFSDKQADELFLLGISATADHGPPHLAKISEVVSEAFMPVAYGGGIRTVTQAGELLRTGIEKVVLNTAAVERPELVREIADRFGSQSVVASIDVKRGLIGGHRVYSHGGRVRTGLDPVEWARRVEALGAGEILLTAIDRDGTRLGYDLEITHRVASAVRIPVVASGGASAITDFARAVNEGGASGVAAGSLFMFQRGREGVLISFPSESELEAELYAKLASLR